MKKSYVILFSVLGLTCLAALWLPPTAENVVQPAARSETTANRSGMPSPVAALDAKQKRTEATVNVLRWDKRQPMDETDARWFEARSWAAPTPIKAAPDKVNIVQPKAAQPEPVAQVPTIPFKVIGRWEDGAKSAVFLEFQQQNLIARVGDVLTPEWRVESIEAGKLVLLYIPLNQKQSLDWPASSP